MIEVRDSGEELRRVRVRLGVLWMGVLACFGLLAARFLYLQVFRYEDFQAQAEDNRIALVPIPPQRGLIYDRNGVLLADNIPAFTLEIVPNRAGDVERTIDALSQVVEVTARDRRRFKRLLEDAKNYESIPIRTRLTDEELAKFAAAKFRFPGVEIRARLFRTYPMGEHLDPSWTWIRDSLGGRFSLRGVRSLEQDLGPYDVMGMAGNMRCWTSSPTCSRGGAWAAQSRASRCSFRVAETPGIRHSMVGVRLVRTAGRGGGGGL